MFVVSVISNDNEELDVGTTTDNIRAFHVVLDAPAARVFDTVRDLRNVPAWLTNWCKGIRLDGPDAWVRTADGEVFFTIEADRQTGVLDWWSGPTKQQATRWPTRVFALPDGRSVYQITAILTEKEAELAVEQLIGEELAALKQLLAS